MSEVNSWFHKATDVITTIKTGLAMGGLTSIWGWFENIGLVGLIGLLGVIANLWWGYKKHKREEEFHSHRMK